jgi:hypothetical protein
MSNGIVRGMDLSATLDRFAGAKVPADRSTDSVDQYGFLLRKTEKSARARRSCRPTHGWWVRV